MDIARENRLPYPQRGRRLRIMLVLWTSCASPSMAAIINTEATVSTTVQELIDGLAGSVNSERKQLGVDLSMPPMMASGELTTTDLDGRLVSAGQGLAQFADPTRLDQPNPEEFALEVAAFSNADSVSYFIQSSAVESRTVLFTRPGNPLAQPEIQFRSDGTRSVESSVFLSGAIVFWSAEPSEDLTDMLAELRVSVTRSDQAAPLFETTLAVAGQEASRVELTSTGPIRFDEVELEELLDNGMSAETAAILEPLASEGTLIVVVIPRQEHQYTYTVRVDERTILTATFEARVRNVPDGTGIAAVLGRPFEDLADFIEPALAGVDGLELQRAINLSAAKRTIGLVPQPMRSQRSAGRAMCGVFGVEAVGLLSLGLFLTLPQRPRRKPGQHYHSVA